jgi:hypothetical protein
MPRGEKDDARKKVISHNGAPAPPVTGLAGNHSPKLLSQVEQGETTTITKRGKPVPGSRLRGRRLSVT